MRSIGGREKKQEALHIDENSQTQQTTRNVSQKEQRFTPEQQRVESRDQDQM
jgi:hypothetical protein